MRSKYKVDVSKKAKQNRTVFDDHLQKTFQFASNIEMKFYTDVLLPLYQNGTIVDYQLQKKYLLQESFRRKDGSLVRKIEYVSDYWIKYSDGKERVIDTKGAGLLVDPVAKLKRKLFEYKYPDVDFCWLTWSKKTGWINWDDFVKLKKQEKKEKQRGIK